MYACMSTKYGGVACDDVIKENFVDPDEKVNALPSRSDYLYFVTNNKMKSMSHKISR